jgi:ribosomal protein S12
MTGPKSPCPALKPKLVVKLSTREEVTSQIKMAFDEFDIASEITVEGTVYVSTISCDKDQPQVSWSFVSLLRLHIIMLYHIIIRLKSSVPTPKRMLPLHC